MVAALAALGVSGAFIYRSVQQELATRPGVAAPATPTAAGRSEARQGDVTGTVDDPAAVRSQLTVIRVGEGEHAQSVLALGRPARSEDFEGAVKGTLQGILIDELMRQAVLIAAREELGVATRDEVVGDSFELRPNEGRIELVTIFRGDKKHAAIRRFDKGKAPTTLCDEKAGLLEWQSFFEDAERLSRTEFVRALEAIGFKKAKRPASGDAAVPDGAAEKHSHLGITDQFTAIRALHAAIRADGESPARLALLARAYAVLGVLTEYQWHPAHKAYKARALLYAERLLARDRQEPVSMWNRAFVEALVGMHDDALKDLVEARKLAQKRSDGRHHAVPEWLPLIEAFLHYDAPKLKSADPSLESLAGLLRMLALEFPQLKTRTLPAARELLQREPECFRAVDLICRIGPIGDLHVATVIGPQILDQLVPQKILAMPSLPEPVSEAIRKKTGEPALVDALTKAGTAGADAGEPSWTALGHVITEARFVHVARRLSFMRYTWSVPVSQFWDENHLLVARHRFRPYLESMSLPAGEAAVVLAEFVPKVDVSDIEITAQPMTNALSRSADPRAQLPWKAAVNHTDQLAFDLGIALTQVNVREIYANRLINSSPYSPFARSVLIEADNAMAREHLDEWRNDPATGHSPAILGALGRRYTKEKRIDDAQAMLSEYVEESPERWAYEMLAQNELGRGHKDQWRDYLEKFLERGENNGLDHAGVQVQIAREYMNRGYWTKARPYAEAAALTWAGWALQCAGQCNEGLGEYERAEGWYRSDTERYPTFSYMGWYLHCLRTMRGDVDGAAQWVDAYFKGRGSALTDGEKGWAVLFYDLSDDAGQGIPFLKDLLATPSPDPNRQNGRLNRWLEHMFLARFADSTGDAKLRDASWAEAAKIAPPGANKVIGMFREAVDAKQDRSFDTKALDAALKPVHATPRSNLAYFAGHFLDRRGNVVEAARYWKQCADGIPGGNPNVWIMGQTALRRRLEGTLPDDAHLYALRGYFHRRQERLDLALKDLNKAIELDPENREAYNYRAIVKRAAGDLPGSIADFTRVIEIAPNVIDYQLGLAITRVVQGEFDRARKEIDSVIEKFPQHIYGPIAKGLLFLAEGKSAEADEWFDKALAQDASVGVTLESLKKHVVEHRR